MAKPREARAIHTGEPNPLELRMRVRRWIQHYYRQVEPDDVQRQEFASTLGFKPSTVSNWLNDREDLPGSIDILARLHFRLGADLAHILRHDPPSTVASPQDTLQAVRRRARK